MNKWMRIEWVSDWVSEWVSDRVPFECPQKPWHDYVIHKLKTERSPVLSTYESQGVQHIYHFMKKLNNLTKISAVTYLTFAV